jgi:hypothetical protein
MQRTERLEIGKKLEARDKERGQATFAVLFRAQLHPCPLTPGNIPISC